MAWPRSQRCSAGPFIVSCAVVLPRAHPCRILLDASLIMSQFPEAFPSPMNFRRETGTGYAHDSSSAQQGAQGQAPQGDPRLADGSASLFGMYLDKAEATDRKMAESWLENADRILVFTGVFSSTVATFIGLSLQNLQPNTQSLAAFHLASIHQLLANTSGSRLPLHVELSDLSTFTTSASAVWVNSFWFLSLVMSLTSALLAMLLQQWAPRYLRITHSTGRSQPERVQTRAFFAQGVVKLRLPYAVEAVPALLHISVFLFFSGLVIFLFGINHTVFSVVTSWIALCAGLYVCITFMPIFRHDSPYYTPLSSLAWYCTTGLLSVGFRLLEKVTLFYLFTPEMYYRRTLNGMGPSMG
ncbi:hypothetical protein BC834DRAFT_876870, partial [Gloeopeniophorella convolvens]